MSTHEAILGALDELIGRTAADVAGRAWVSVGTARKKLRELAASGLAERSEVPQHAGDSARMEIVWKRVRP